MALATSSADLSQDNVARMNLLTNNSATIFHHPIVVTFNVGSATIKMAAYDSDDDIDHINDAALATSTIRECQPLFDININLKTHQSIWHHQPAALSTWQPTGSLTDTAVSLFNALKTTFPDRQIVCVHRIVHGGLTYKHPIIIDDTVMAKLIELSPICPLHQPPALSVVNALHQLDNTLIHIAAFDTAFHHARSPIWATYALPRELREKGIQCYGFHGLSYQAILRKLRAYQPLLAEQRLIVAHLGSGCSITAIHHGESVDSTLGFSGLDGVPMGTRVGHLDPAVVLYLVEQGWCLEDMNRCLYKESGLLGLSEISNDVEVLLASDDPRAKFALDYFAAHTAKHIASLMVSLKGCNALIFTAGIGEHAPVIREKIVAHLAFLGFFIDTQLNNTASSSSPIVKISSENSKPMFVILTDEQLELYLSYQFVTKN